MNISNRLKQKIFTSFFFSLGLTFSAHTLSAQHSEQLDDKKNGIELYNQYKTTTAIPYLEKAAKTGDQEAQYYLGEALRKKNRYMTPEAQNAYEASALQGNIYSMIRLADNSDDLCVAMGNCPEGRKDPKEWLEIAKKTAGTQAAEGNAESMYLMFRITGNDEWLEKSAANGFAFAQYYLGTGYRDGKGFFILPSKRNETVENLMKASAEGGYPRGMMEYAAIRAEKKDFENYRSWNKKAAEAGYTSAVYGYALNLSTKASEFGFPYDPITSYALMHLLLELDGGGDILDAAKYSIEKISENLSSEQIEKAKILSKEWKANHPPLSYFPDKL
ncbi:tetratricopeptide repeat protein [Pseudomonas chlororaphis]|uniref:tetratricopeptide repeat protein n=2 Tax=Pseudomonas chlororaphis TaxID=587753 RepID=UPI001F36C2B4|nr:sel1 repeat family protein [Pseudomonas chlororaphis]